MRFRLIYCLMVVCLFLSCQEEAGQSDKTGFEIEIKNNGDQLVIVRASSRDQVLTQNAKSEMRPYLHPIMSPDGNGSLTEYSPGHHKHQTGLYWGFTRVNGSGAPADTLKKWFYRPNKPDHIQQQIGRDYFHNNGASHWKKVSAEVLKAKGEDVQWQTVYHMLDAAGEPILEETMLWKLSEKEGQFLIDLEWQGKALLDITINSVCPAAILQSPLMARQGPTPSCPSTRQGVG